jgi:hypothetical protein
MVKSPGAYRWSSYRANAQGLENALIQPHPLYLALGRTKQKRMEAYKALFSAHIDDDLADIRASLQTGTPLGNDYFRKKSNQNSNARSVRPGAADLTGSPPNHKYGNPGLPSLTVRIARSDSRPVVVRYHSPRLHRHHRRCSELSGCRRVLRLHEYPAAVSAAAGSIDG